MPGIVYTHALSTSAASAVVTDMLSGAVLYAKNEHQRRAMASTTKIMTAIIVLEYGELQAKCRITAADAAVEGSALGIRKGEVLRVGELLRALMLVSGNDTAHALARAVCGSQKAFVAKMNEKARLLGLSDTHFTNPAGLTHPNHYSTALDMARLSAYALQNKHFRAICSKKEAWIHFLSPEKRVKAVNHNRLLREYEGCIGIKTGYTAAAGRCLVSAASRQGQTLIAVSLGDADDWRDHKRMLDNGFAKSGVYTYDFAKVRIPVVGSAVHALAPLQKTFRLALPKQEIRYLKMQVLAPHFLYAPVKKGQQIACAQLLYKGKVIKRVPLYAPKNAERQILHQGVFERLFQYGKFFSAASKGDGG